MLAAGLRLWENSAPFPGTPWHPPFSHPPTAEQSKVLLFPGSPFRLHQPFEPAGDQPEAIDKLVEGIEDGLSFQTLLGVTGSGKTYTMANVIARLGRPALIMAPNKTLAAQLYSEMREFFPENAVEYFVSYYDYYQPEAYVPSRDLYIEKDSSINEHIEQMRLSATKSLLERPDTVIVATVSCIYGIGDPVDYHSMILHLRSGERSGQRDIIKRLAEMQYERNEMEFRRGTFRVRGDVLDIFPAENSEVAVRVNLFDDEVEELTLFDPLTGHILRKVPRYTVYPSSHYVTPRGTTLRAIEAIKAELRERIEFFQRQGKLLEAQRIEQRTRFDLEMLDELGFCKGIENYSRHLSGRQPGEPPPTLIDYLPHNALMIIDESHVTIPQIGGMYRGDRARKENLVDYGFRLPSALDNRPLTFEEFERMMPQTIFVSATPAEYEAAAPGPGGGAGGAPDRPGGPEVIVRPAATQVDDLLSEINARVATGRARAGHHAHQAHGRGPDRLSRRARHQGALPALGHRHRRAGRDHPRPAPGRIRRAGRHQPAARGAGHPRGVAGGDPGRGQGRLPALRALADPDHRPRRAPHQWHRDHVRRPGHRVDAARHRRDRAPPQQADRLQHRARHHAAAA